MIKAEFKCCLTSRVTLFTGKCTTRTFKKSDGKCACGFFLEKGLSWRQASDQCRTLGARLPEIKSAQENDDIFSVKVCTRTQQFILEVLFYMYIVYEVLYFNIKLFFSPKSI
jgi:hypothetical protein